MKELEKPSNKIGAAIRLLEEKLTKEYNLTIDELRQSTITIKNGDVTVTKKGKK